MKTGPINIIHKFDKEWNAKTQDLDAGHIEKEVGDYCLFEKLFILDEKEFYKTYFYISQNTEAYEKSITKVYEPIEEEAGNDSEETKNIPSSVSKQAEEETLLYKKFYKLFNPASEKIVSHNFPGILKYDQILNSSSGKYYLSSRYIRGRSLEDHIKPKSTFSESEIIEFLMTILTTLVDMLSEGIVHYAVTPDHILVESIDSKLVFFLGAIEHTVESSMVEQVPSESYEFGDYSLEFPNLSKITKEMHYKNYAYALGSMALQLLTGNEISDMSSKTHKHLTLKKHMENKNISIETYVFLACCLSGEGKIEEFEAFKSHHYSSSSLRLSDFTNRTLISETSTFAKVYKALYKDSIVAIKEFKKFPSESQITNIKRIQKIVSNSKYLVQIKDSFVEKGKFYIVMNTFEGKNLSEIIAEKGLTLEKVRIIAWDIASALFEMHHKNFVHRDVKPKNIFLSTSNNKAILIDIDTARLSTEINTGFGTPKYWAPEVRDRITETDLKKADIYSFGKVLHEMWNSLPFEGEEVKSEAMDLVFKCTKTDFNDRLPIEEVINHPFFLKFSKIAFHPPPSMKEILYPKTTEDRQYFIYKDRGVDYTIVRYKKDEKIQRSLLMWKNCEQLESISKITEIFSHGEFIFAQIQKIENADSLRNIVEKAKSMENYSKIREILSQKIIYLLLKTIEDLHLLHISHRSLDPDILYIKNILDEKPQLFVNEMYVAKASFEDRSISDKGKQCAFYAPEFYTPSKKKQFDMNKLDIWSFGVLFYYMLSFKEPCEPDKEGVNNFYKNSDNIDWSSVADSHKEIIKKCLQKDPSQRPTIQSLFESFTI